MEAFVTLEDLRAYLSIDVLDVPSGEEDPNAKDDALLQDCIDRALTLIARLTKRTFLAPLSEAYPHTETTRTFDAIEDVEDDGVTLNFDQDLYALTTLTNGDAVVETAYILKPKSGPPYDAVKLLASSGKVWTYDTDPEVAIEIKGVWAWGPCPADLMQAGIRLAAWIYRQKEVGPDLDRPIIAPDGSVVMPQRLPADVLEIVSGYRRVTVHG